LDPYGAYKPRAFEAHADFHLKGNNIPNMPSTSIIPATRPPAIHQGVGPTVPSDPNFSPEHLYSNMEGGMTQLAHPKASHTAIQVELTALKTEDVDQDESSTIKNNMNTNVINS